jgi:hypothetical protein
MTLRLRASYTLAVPYDDSPRHSQNETKISIRLYGNLYGIDAWMLVLVFDLACLRTITCDFA